MDGSCQWMSFTSSSSSSSYSHGGQDGPPPKRPAGRTKFKETRHPVYSGVRHPVYRGVRRRGRAGRWVCEVRVPGTGTGCNKRGQRLWLGTYLSAECAGRAHDAAMLMLRGAPAEAAARILNFPDSEWLLDVPIACPDGLPSVRRAAVANFQRREPSANGAAAAVPDLDEAAAVSWAAASSQLVPRANNNGGMLLFDFEVPVAAMDSSGGMFELDDICGETNLDMYYAELAGALLMEPPPDAWACWQGGDAGADTDLWSCC